MDDRGGVNNHGCHYYWSLGKVCTRVSFRESLLLGLGFWLLDWLLVELNTCVNGCVQEQKTIGHIVPPYLVMCFPLLGLLSVYGRCTSYKISWDWAIKSLLNLHLYPLLLWSRGLELWTKPTPIAVTCLLHEIMPAGGGDKMISTTATPFDETPEGALRINPLEIKRILSTHPWLVPVKASRVPELDDPIRPLWPRREPPVAYHVLGGASFEPCKYTNKEQWDEITIRLKGSDDVGSLSGRQPLHAA